MSKHNRCDISVEQPTKFGGDQPEDSEGARYCIPQSLLLRE
jgi:hypothetical protein